MKAPRTKDDRLPPALEFIQRFCLIPGPGGRLVPMVLHQAQRLMLEAWEALGPDGFLLYLTFWAYWIKKSGKSTFGGALGVKELVAGQGHDREIIVVSSTYEQSRDRTFNAAKKFCARHPWLAKAVKTYSDTLVFKETIIDPSTGGRYHEEHTLKAVPSNPEGQHGAEPSLTIYDEAHTLNDYAMLEALAPAPTKPVSRRLFLSYAGLRWQQRRGVPLWDLDVAWRAKTLPADTYVSYLGGETGWRSIPWITPKFIESQRQSFEAAPSRFERLYLNVWAADDQSLITRAEIEAAVADYTEPPRGDSGTYWCAVDLAVRWDWSCVLIGHVDQQARLAVDVIRTWQPTRERAVSLSAVVDELQDLYTRFAWADCWFDQSQSQLAVEQLHRLHIPARVVDVTSPFANQVVTSLKAAFSRRLVTIPAGASALIEQLESVRAIETRRGLLRLTEGGKSSAGDARAHDDLAFCLGLLVLMAGDAVGRVGLPEQSGCYRAESIGQYVPCYLWESPGYVPSGDPSCRACPAHQAVLTGWREQGRGLDLRTYRELHAGDNQLTRRMKMLRWELVDHGL